jgi:hypothetical protein
MRSAEARPNRAVVRMCGIAHDRYACSRIRDDPTLNYCESHFAPTRDALNAHNSFICDPHAAKHVAGGASRSGMGVGGTEFQTDLHAARRGAQSYITQVGQTTLCNRHHSIDQQLCRWLLMFLDRQASNELPLTHEHIVEVMGVRRESVTEAARRLQIAGCIRYQRGHISVVDRTALEARSCECYEIVKRETNRLLDMSQSAKMAATPAAVDRVRSRRSEPSIRHASSNFV